MPLGTVAVERYRVPVFEREAPLRAGAGLRFTRMDIDPANAEEWWKSMAPPRSHGWRRPRGSAAHCCSSTGDRAFDRETIWRNPKRLAASRSAAAAVRVETVAPTGCVIRAVEEYGLVFSSARNP